MGNNDIIVYITVINLMNAFFFIGLDRSHLTNQPSYLNTGMLQQHNN